MAMAVIVTAALWWKLYGDGFNDDGFNGSGDSDEFNSGGDAVVEWLLVQAWVVLLMVIKKVVVVRVLEKFLV